MKKSLFLSTDILCFSCQRWDLVYQRSQHLLSRFGQKSRVFYIEEPVFDAETSYYSSHAIEGTQVVQIVFHLPANSTGNPAADQQALLAELMNTEKIRRYMCWYNTPVPLVYTMHLDPLAIVYDYLQDHSLNRPRHYESLLLEKANIVFMPGYHLFDTKRHFHHTMYCFPNSIDKSHFITARYPIQEPIDQLKIPHPRIGFYGAIDERLDMTLLKSLADDKPGWHFILVGPVIGIDASAIPQSANIHLLGAKEYNELPQYLAGWDLAMMPFGLNETTDYNNPASIPEYLAAGKPVVATPVYDIVHPYGKKQLVQIAHNTKEFIKAIEKVLAASRQSYSRWLAKVDKALETQSWDKTFRHMEILIEAVMERNRKSHWPLVKRSREMPQ